MLQEKYLKCVECVYLLKGMCQSATSFKLNDVLIAATEQRCKIQWDIWYAIPFHSQNSFPFLIPLESN